MLKPFKNQEAEHGKRSIAKRCSWAKPTAHTGFGILVKSKNYTTVVSVGVDGFCGVSALIVLEKLTKKEFFYVSGCRRSN
jgi:hypothetical protein